MREYIPVRSQTGMFSLTWEPMSCDWLQVGTARTNQRNARPINMLMKFDWNINCDFDLDDTFQTDTLDRTQLSAIRPMVFYIGSRKPNLPMK